MDGRNDGEKLVGLVYDVCGNYTIHKDKVLAGSWLELLEKELDAR